MKKNKELLDIMGDIRDEYIENARPKSVIHKRKIRTSALSAVALLALTAGLQYQFLYRPLSKGTDISENNSSAVTDNTEISFTEKITETDFTAEITEISRENSAAYFSETPLRPKDGTGVFFLEEKSFPSSYISLKSGDTEYDFGRNIRGSLRNNCNISAAETEEYMIVFYNGRVFAQHKNTDEVFSAADNSHYHSEMDLSGSTQLLGSDTSGYVYVYNYNSNENYGVIHKYLPDLSSYKEFYIDIEGIFPLASGFDDLYSDENNNIVYVYDGGSAQLVYSPESGEITSDYDFTRETLDKNTETGISRYGDYIYAPDSSDETVLTLYTDSTPDNRGISHRDADDDSYNVSCTEGCVSAYTRENDMETTVSKIKFTVNPDGTAGTWYDSSDGTEPLTVIQENEADASVKISLAADYTPYEAYYMLSDSRYPETTPKITSYDYDESYIYIFADYDTGNGNKHTDMFVISYYMTVKSEINPEPELILITEKIFDPNIPDELSVSAAALSSSGEEKLFVCLSDSSYDTQTGSVDLSGKYTEIKVLPSLKYMNSICSLPSPQSDGTFVYAQNGYLFSFDSHSGNLKTLCHLSEKYSILTGDVSDIIYKINDSAFLLPPSSFSSDTNDYALLTLK